MKMVIALLLGGVAWGQTSFSGTVVGVVQGGVKIKTARGQQLVVPRTMLFRQNGRQQWFGNLVAGAPVTVEAPDRRRELLVSAEANPQKVGGPANVPYLGYYLPQTEYVYVPINSTDAYLDNNYNNPYSYVYQNSAHGNASLTPAATTTPGAATAPAVSRPVRAPSTQAVSSLSAPAATSPTTPVGVSLSSPAAASPAPPPSASLTSPATPGFNLNPTLSVQPSASVVLTTPAAAPTVNSLSSAVSGTTSSLTNLTSTAANLVQTTTQSVLSLPSGLLGH